VLIYSINVLHSLCSILSHNLCTGLQVQTAKTPTAHGEISTINGYFQSIPDDLRLPAADTIFLATHQPCSLCMSGLAFAGFR
jgi:tRNA(Arg) A34 adenosine deaminase TadA